MRDSGAYADLITFSVANTFSVSENVLHRFPIGKHSLVLKNMHTVKTSPGPLTVIYGAEAKEPAFLTCPPVDSVHPQAGESLAPGTSDLCSVNSVLLGDAGRG